MTDAVSFFALVLGSLRQESPVELNALLTAGPPVGTLVDALRDPASIDEHGTTPLFLAVHRRNVAGVQRLLEICPGLALDRNGEGHTPLMVAARHRDPALVQRLLPVSDLAVEEPMFHETVMEQVVRHAHPAVVESFLPYLADAPRNRAGLTPLMIAAIDGLAGTVRQLAPVSDPDARTPDGRTALMLAALNGTPENLRALLPWSDVNAVDQEGHNVTDLLQERLAMASRARWACVDLVLLFEHDADKARRVAGRAAPSDLPLWHDAALAGQERHLIVSERERRELRATLDDAVATVPAKPRARL